MESKFKNYEMDPTWAAQQKEQAQAKGQSQERTNVKYKFSVGTTKFRVMGKYKEDRNSGWFVESLEHFNPVKTVCPQLFGDRCPICEESSSLYDQGLQEQARELRPDRKWWVNAIILAEENGYKQGATTLSAKDGIYALKLPTKVKNFLLDMDTDFAAGYGDITNLETGYDVFVDRAATFSTDMYKSRLFAKPTNIVEELAKLNIDINTFSLVNLDELIVPMSYDEIVEGMRNQEQTADAKPAVQPVKLGVVSPGAKTVSEPDVAPNPMKPVVMSNARPAPMIPKVPLPPKIPGKGN